RAMMRAANSRPRRALRMCAMAVLAACLRASPPAHAAGAPLPLASVAFDQRLGAQLPMQAPFIDAAGHATNVADALDGRAGIVVLGYYECPNLCSAVRQALLASLAQIDLEPGSGYRVLAVSIDPAETDADAQHAQSVLADGVGSTPEGGIAGALPGWHFLTGEHASSAALASAVGFHYVYDDALKQYAHPSGVVVVTPRGRVSRYFFGVDYPPAQLRASLVAAAGETVGSPVRALLLRCFHYDPVTGRYSLAVIDAMRLCALLSIAGLLVFVAWRRRHAPTAGPTAGPAQ
ncbi:MAG: SCO family protein, partial [Casimicrobiaceae bacterium]